MIRPTKSTANDTTLWDRSSDFVRKYAEITVGLDAPPKHQGVDRRPTHLDPRTPGCAFSSNVAVHSPTRQQSGRPCDQRCRHTGAASSYRPSGRSGVHVHPRCRRCQSRGRPPRSQTPPALPMPHLPFGRDPNASRGQHHAGAGDHRTAGQTPWRRRSRRGWQREAGARRPSAKRSELGSNRPRTSSLDWQM